MEIVSACPLRVTSVVWQPRPGAWALTAIIKATYRLEPLRSPLSDAQELPADEDNHWDHDPARSLYAPSDRVPFKRRPEVLLVGHAFAPGGRPVRSLVARLQVGEMDKSIEVWCDRVFAQDGQLLEGRPFTTMPLRWERAAGGPGTWNPVGMRFDASPDLYGAVAVPNLQPPGHHVASRGETFAPIGVGPVAPTWPSRAGRLTPESAAGWAARWFALPLPEGLDASFFSSAPPDQQVDELRPDERIVLENLHPAHPRLVTNLAGVTPRAVAERVEGTREEVRLVADTLWIDTDRGVATLVWRGSIGLRQPQEAGRVVVWVDGEGANLAVQPQVAVGGEEGEDEDAIRTMVPQAMTVATGRENEQEIEDEVVRTAPAPLKSFSSAAALPFREGPAALTPTAPSRGTAASEENVSSRVMLEASVHTRGQAVGETLTAPLLSPATVLPFGQASAGVARASSAFERPLWSPPNLGITSGGQTEAIPVPSPAPPPMIGPLARMEMSAPPEPDLPAVSGTMTSPAPDGSAASPGGPEPEIAEFPIERCAAITAAMARRRAESARILEAHDLTSCRWATIEQYWSEAIRKETAKGKRALLMAFDAAYVAQLEKERGPIQVEEYARLVVAAERGNTDEILADLTLPRGALMRIERVWLEKISDDAGLAGSVTRAVEVAREE